MTFKMTRRAWMRTFIYSGVALTGGLGYLSSRRIEVVRSDVPIADLPRHLNGLKIGVMADFHAGTFTSYEEIQYAVRRINEEKPDLIAILGDYVDGTFNHSAKNVHEGAYVFEALKELDNKIPAYAVLGNHDHWSDAALVRKKLAELRLVMLNNQNVILGNSIAIVGVDDYWDGPSDPDLAMKNISSHSLVIMLSHNPDVNKQIKWDNRVRLVLSGHTHGGQVRMPIINWTPLSPCDPKYRGISGLVQETERRSTFITKGIGTSFLPVRIACAPDIAIVRLKKV